MKKIFSFFDIILNNFSQMLFFENRLIGLLILLAIYSESFLHLSLCLLSSIINLTTLKLLKVSSFKIKSGTSGFNAPLTVLSVFYIIPELKYKIFIIIFLSIITAIISKIFDNFFNRKNLKELNLPFIITAFTFIVIYNNFFTDLDHYSSLEVISNKENLDLIQLLINESILGISQTIFLGNILSGTILTLTLYIKYNLSIFYIILSSLVSFIILSLLLNNNLQSELGVFGFNTVLTTIYIKNNFDNKKLLLYLSIPSIIIAYYAIAYIFINNNLPILTIPFFLIASILSIFINKTKTGPIKKENFTQNY